MRNVTVFQTPLANRDRNQNALRALCKLIPSIGEGLDQLIFGSLDELRSQRIERTLDEVLQLLAHQNLRPAQSEEFANLLERALPRISRATSEEVRVRFRDLLTKSATIPAGQDDKWAQASIAEELLSELEAPGLAILAARARFKEARAFLYSKPQCQFLTEDQFKEIDSQDNARLVVDPIPYSWPVIEEWVRRLEARRLIFIGSRDARGGFGDLVLTALGKMLVEWTVAN